MSAMTISDINISGYLTSEFEGISKVFTEITPLPSSGYCNLYKAKRYGRWFLLKSLKSEKATDPIYQQMLRKEFEILMRLQHPAIMQTFGMEQVRVNGEDEVCIVAEWIDGCTLNDYLCNHPSLQDRRRIAKELAEALSYIHQQQIVHRDLKPSNIMITHNGSYLKVVDFGLADTDSHAILKQPAGTMKYMAPEQAEKAVPDVRNDIYSLGVILQEMNLGKGIYNKVIEKCLRPIHQRYQNMDELLGDLNRSRRHHWKTWALVVMAAVIIIALISQVYDVSHKAAALEKHTAELNLQLRVLNHEIIDFKDPHAKQICIDHWDTDHDGELSFVEAAAVKELGTVFMKDSLLCSFDELEHFTGLKEISSNAFWDCNRLVSIQLPRNIRYIRQNAFRSTALQMVTIPGSVVAVGDHIFEDCSNLETVIFESFLPSVNSGSHPLANCPRLSEIFAQNLFQASNPEKAAWKEVASLITRNIRFKDPQVKAICVAHWDRDGDHELSIDEAANVTSLGTAFTGKGNITRFDELRFFTGLTTIEANAFEKCWHLQSVRLPSSLRTVGEYAFVDCNLQSIYIPSGVNSLAPTFVASNLHLRHIVVSPDNPVYDSREQCNAVIETATNRMQTGSAAATIPRSVTSLSDECFIWYACDELIIPSQITRIGLWSLTSLFKRVYCESPVPPAFNSQGGQAYLFPPAHLNYPEPDIYVPYGSIDAYRQAEGWSFFAHRLREYPARPSSFFLAKPNWTNLDQAAFFEKY